jgi:hypothetical protein
LKVGRLDRETFVELGKRVGAQIKEKRRGICKKKKRKLDL